MDLERFVLANETAIRLGFFLAVLLLIGLWEIAAPRRALTASKSMRWTSNLSIVALNTVLLRLALPLAATGVAAIAAANGWGLLNHLQLPTWLAVPLAVIAMDFVIWLQHLMMHAVPALWHLHRVHHADLDYDVTTGSRFHPIEISLSMLIKVATITLLGPPVLAVVIFEVLLNATAMFNHGNIRIPAIVDGALRWFVVTPDMHRVHHSVQEDETDSNFGFNLPWWDRVFGTYKAQPRAGHVGMKIGIRGHRNPREVARLDGMLLMPFRGEVHGAAVDPRDRRSEHAAR